SITLRDAPLTRFILVVLVELFGWLFAFVVVRHTGHSGGESVSCDLLEGHPAAQDRVEEMGISNDEA
ncbi:MAG: hypothetical protein WD333_09275, partial [Dehalococcoidia bacterium]